ncbi:MAG: hypothetical protein VX683_06615 [Cyanobacteriota bacterium]|nr:hypothetical protein [Cyanobacteriota bacterium]
MALFPLQDWLLPHVDQLIRVDVFAKVKEGDSRYRCSCWPYKEVRLLYEENWR